MSKLFLQPIDAINSPLYRNGPGMLKHRTTMKGTVFMEISSQGEEFFPLAEKFIKRSKQELTDLDQAGKEFGNKPDLEEEKCFNCNSYENCGLFLTRAQTKVLEKRQKEKKMDVEEQEENGLDKKGTKRKLTGASCIGQGFLCKKKKTEMWPEKVINGDLHLTTGQIISSMSRERERKRRKGSFHFRGKACCNQDSNTSLHHPVFPKNTIQNC
jgi:hypothetical protein